MNPVKQCATKSLRRGHCVDFGGYAQMLITFFVCQESIQYEISLSHWSKTSQGSKGLY